MLIGTDVSIQECKDSGNLILKYDGRKPFNPDLQVKFIQYEPDYIDFPGKEEVILDTHCIWGDYELHKKAIDSYCDCDYTFPVSYQELLRVADSVNAYLGIFY